MSRSGVVALAGRPNVGKSTFVNRAAGEKVAIVSDRAQTTRRAIRGVHHSGENELVFIDLPGVQRPRDALTERMSALVRRELEGADLALLLLDGEQGIGPGDRFIARLLAAGARPVTLALNKIDRLSRPATAHALAAAAQLGEEWEVFPVSAYTGRGLADLLAHLAALAPEGPFLFEPGTRTDQPLPLRIAELIREAVIRRTFQELPHAVEVLVEDLERPRADLARVRALIWVESESQKRIVIGSGGRMVKAIGIAGRRELERELGCHVHLDLSVRVRPRWRADEALLDRLGIG